MISLRVCSCGLLALVFFVVLSAIALAPLTLHLNSRVPGEPPGSARVLDYYHFHWNLWWLRHAVQTGQDPFYTDMVLAPFRHNLTYHSLTASLLPVYVIFEPLAGHLRTANGIIWGCLALTGWLMAVFLRCKGVSRAVALLGGVALALAPYMLDHAASGHLNLLTLFWIPLVLLAWEKFLAARAIRWAALTGVILWGMWLTDTLIVLWGGLLLGPYALLALVQARDGLARRRLVLLGGLALVITLALAWIVGPLRQTLDFETGTCRRGRPLRVCWPHRCFSQGATEPGTAVACGAARAIQDRCAGSAGGGLIRWCWRWAGCSISRARAAAVPRIHRYRRDAHASVLRGAGLITSGADFDLWSGGYRAAASCFVF